MSIIIDQFQINTAKPIENRIVVGGTSFYQTRALIEYKYPGLRTWDLNDNLPYYWTGTEWLNENSTSVSFDTTVDIGYLPKFTTTKSTLGKSIIYESGTVNGNIGIGLVGNNIMPSNAYSAPTKGLHVSGNIRTDNNFLGNGQYITDLNASNITTGSLSIARIAPASAINRYALQSVSGVPTWVVVEAVSTNSASSDSIKITNDDDSGSANYLTFVSSTSNYNTLKVSQAKINYIPSTGQILLSNGSAASPAYTFISAANTGIYYAGGAVRTSIAGAEITRTNANGLAVVNGTLYLPISTANNGRSPFGISWAINGDYGVNDGFYANAGSWITNYGIGGYSPDNNGYIGTYISGYYAVEIFTGGKSKLKIDGNTTTIESNLNAKNSLTVTSDVTITSLASGGVRNIGVDNSGKIIPIQSNGAQQYDIKAIYADSTYLGNNFESNGLGKKLRAGWAICNGNNGTPNISNRVIVNYGSDFPTLNAVGGSKDAVLVQHNHTYSQYVQSGSNSGSGGEDAGYFKTGLTSTIGEPGVNKNMQPYIVLVYIMKL